MMEWDMLSRKKRYPKGPRYETPVSHPFCLVPDGNGPDVSSYIPHFRKGMRGFALPELHRISGFTLTLTNQSVPHLSRVWGYRLSDHGATEVHQAPIRPSFGPKLKSHVGPRDLAPPLAHNGVGMNTKDHSFQNAIDRPLGPSYLTHDLFSTINWIHLNPVKPI